MQLTCDKCEQVKDDLRLCKVSVKNYEVSEEYLCADCRLELRLKDFRVIDLE